MRKLFAYTLFLLSLILCFPSCSKQSIRETSVDSDPSDTSLLPTTYQHGIFVINEGNFNWGNASVTFIDYSANKTVQKIYQKANARNLGDVAESMKIFGALGYIVVNNSNRIEIVDFKSFKSLKTITGLHSPRHIEFVDSNKAYVTSLQRGISILDLHSNEITGTIAVHGWTENLVRFNHYMFVAAIGEFNKTSSRRKAQILVIDTRTDQIIDSIPTGKEPIGLAIDNKEKIWALCSGGYDYFEIPSIIKINPELRKVEEVFKFPTTQRVPSRLSINTLGDTLYFLNGGIFQMPIHSKGVPAFPLVNPNGRLFYGLTIHPVTGNIFVSDALDYVQNGVVYQYSPSGTLISQYTVGRIPGSFCFTPDDLH
ncbi:MAG: YncE family protein [Bacteroidales bacterium]|jgi:YVTN family beta-propeller protein|nr:YncE family protein [Bacteroidales bacterium]